MIAAVSTKMSSGMFSSASPLDHLVIMLTILPG